jgi:hypothetical protein
MSSTPRWHRPLLPGELRDDADGRRSARDWVVDAVMALVALVVGLAVLADSWDAHSPAMRVVDVAIGLASFVALRWRRARPDAVGALTAAASICSAFAGGPALVAGFNVALRGSRRGSSSSSP